MSILGHVHDEARAQWREERRRLEQYVLSPQHFDALITELCQARDQYAVGVDAKRGVEWVLVYLDGQKCKVIKGK